MRYHSLTYYIKKWVLEKEKKEKKEFLTRIPIFEFTYCMQEAFSQDLYSFLALQVP